MKTQYPMSIDYATFVTGGLSDTSKMPCKSFNIPAEFCHTGSKLRDIQGSTCSKCYALKGFYGFPDVQGALFVRMENLYHPDWVQSMAYLITMKSPEYFRWFDSGDIQDMENLQNIVAVCKATPNTYHWLPTREKGLISKYIARHGDFPPNLVVRLSMPMIGMRPMNREHFYGRVQTSTVDSTQGHVCPASKQENQCGPCRACWNGNVENVDYIGH